MVRNDIINAATEDGEWDAIVTTDEIKSKLLRSAVLGMQVRGRLSFHVSALHGLILVVGPPGTGKSTLVRGLAGQVARVVSQKKCRLIEINPHGLMSGEHGKSQQQIHALLTEYIPTVADDKLPTILMLDEVESLAVARSEASLAANPADVHRATDAVLTALDELAVSHPHIVVVATSNFTGALDEAFKSRADVIVEMPMPDAAAVHAILRQTLEGFGGAYPSLRLLSKDPRLAKVARTLAGSNGRAVRKSVTEAMLLRLDVALAPGRLTIEDLQEVADGQSLTRLEATHATL